MYLVSALASRQLSADSSFLRCLMVAQLQKSSRSCSTMKRSTADNSSFSFEVVRKENERQRRGKTQGWRKNKGSLWTHERYNVHLTELQKSLCMHREMINYKILDNQYMHVVFIHKTLKRYLFHKCIKYCILHSCKTK